MNTASQTASLYQSVQIKTASNQRLVCMLHNKCVQCIVQALDAEGESKKDLIRRAQNILAELERSLKIEDELTQSLFYLYDYSYTLLDRNDSGEFQRAITVLSLIRDTFDQLSKGCLEETVSPA
jgi:flagellar protein FliS